MRLAPRTAITMLAGVIGCLVGMGLTGTAVAQVDDVSIDQPFTDDFSDPASGWDVDEDVGYVDGGYVKIGRAHV